MTVFQIALNSARHYWRTNLGVVLGVALATTVLVGALFVGDSVRETLRQIALQRVGKSENVMFTQDRFFRAELASDFAKPQHYPGMILLGSASLPDGSARANQVQVVGTGEGFFDLAPGADAPEYPENGAFINERLARQLGVTEPGQTIVLRVEKPGDVSRDAPLSGPDDATVALRLKVAAILSAEQWGNFSLQASQVPPFSIFLPLDLLSEEIDKPGRANLMVGPALVNSLEELKTLTARAWTLDDLEYELREFKPFNLAVELRSRRIFLDKSTGSIFDNAEGALTYFVNSLSKPGHDVATPYSMVSAISGGLATFAPRNWRDNEILINEWLAEDVGAEVGDDIELRYFVLGEKRGLTETSRTFRVVKILPMEGPSASPDWMPEFPGISDADDCSEWDPGVPVDLDKIREKDEDYWDDFRGTPKAFVTLQAGEEMWANRFGNRSSIIVRDRSLEEVREALRRSLKPEERLLVWEPFREQALAATNSPVDFGGLFIALSFFLAAAAAILIGLLFVFSVTQRNAQAGLLLSLGWKPGRVRGLFLVEGGALAVAGVLLGLVGAYAYVAVVLAGLESIWSDAVGSVRFALSTTLTSVLGGGIAALVMAVLVMWFATRQQLKSSARELLSGRLDVGGSLSRVGVWNGIAGMVSSLLAIGLVVAGFFGLGGSSGPERAGVFFCAGSLLLLAGPLLCRGGLGRSHGTADAANMADLGARNAGRARGRALAVAVVLACGVFLVVAVGAFRHYETQQPGPRESGTGGFALVGESAVPIFTDLNSKKGQEVLGLPEGAGDDFSVVPIRVSGGDDASCLNLNRALQPRLFGVDAEELARRGAFGFSSIRATTLEEGPVGSPWELLNRRRGQSGGVVPAIIDENTAMWALGKMVGDRLVYTDGKHGQFEVEIVGMVSSSLLQGNILISEKDFIAKYPGAAGYRYFLIDAPAEKIPQVQKILSRALQDRGFQITPSWRRFGEFKAVENTYISIFQMLGGLGLLLGSLGLAIVVARNALERRSELALLQAVGWQADEVRRLLWYEHRWLIVWGLGIGAVSAVVAVLPTLVQRLEWATLLNIAGLVFSVLILGLFWIGLAVRWVLASSGPGDLRSE